LEEFPVLFSSFLCLQSLTFLASACFVKGDTVYLGDRVMMKGMIRRGTYSLMWTQTHRADLVFPTLTVSILSLARDGKGIWKMYTGSIWSWAWAV